MTNLNLVKDNGSELDNKVNITSNENSDINIEMLKLYTLKINEMLSKALNIS